MSIANSSAVPFCLVENDACNELLAIFQNVSHRARLQGISLNRDLSSRVTGVEEFHQLRTKLASHSGPLALLLDLNLDLPDAERDNCRKRLTTMFSNSQAPE